MENRKVCNGDKAFSLRESNHKRCKLQYISSQLSVIYEVDENISSLECFLQKFHQICAEVIWE